MLTDNRVTLSKCSCEQTSKALGVRICAEASYPASTKADAPYFPFTGPVSAAIELQKTDDHQAYEFEAYLKAEKQNGAVNRFARLAFNTPGSKVDREIFVDVTLDSAGRKVSANLQTPWKMATIDGKCTVLINDTKYILICLSEGFYKLTNLGDVYILKALNVMQNGSLRFSFTTKEIQYTMNVLYSVT